MAKEPVKDDFLRVVKNVPDWMIRSYEITVALEAYEKTKQKLIEELGEAGAARIEAQNAHEIAEELCGPEATCRQIQAWEKTDESH